MSATKALHYVTTAMALAVIACGPTIRGVIPSATSPQTPTSGGLETAVYEAIPAVTSPASPSADEAILILAPGAGSRLVGRVHVEGVADSTFEQALLVEVVAFGDAGETVLASVPTTIEAELGARGPYSAEVIFETAAAGDMAGEVRVFASSPRDGGITHLASVPVTLAAGGAEDIRPGEMHPERILIVAPTPGQAVVGGVVHVEGIALATFEGTLVVEIYDVDGTLIGSSPTTVAAPDMGLPGPFAVDLAYTASAAWPARVVVRDPSPAFGQTVHLASVEIRIEP